MTKLQLDFKSLLDIPQWETIQDQLAKCTNTAIITIDFKGNPLTKHSGCTEFCSVIRGNPVSRKRCYKCDALAGLEAVRLGKALIYLCHCGIVDTAVPVIVGDKYLGAVMFGQVRIPNNDTDMQVKRLVSEISSFQPEQESAREDLLEMYERLPEMEYGRIVEIAELIDSIMKYIIDRAMKKYNDTLTYEWLLNMDAGPSDLAGGEMVLPQRAALKAEPEPSSVSYNSPIYPAVAYIDNHIKESITMGEMAKLCHLSASYFSRLFQREMGDNFTNYVNRQKIEIAKQQLRETSKSISQIAGELGYLNISHFINLFKRFEGVTPAVFRQYKFR